jgi:hypothetical protein
VVNFSMRGWLPTGIHFDHQPAVVPGARVRWLEVGVRRLSEPFLWQTLGDLRAATPPPTEVDTDLDTLLRIGRSLPACPPSGLIFHVSHCGSTLVANVLRTAENTVVVSEPRAITGLLRSYTQPHGRYLAERWNLTRKAVLEALFALYACYRTGAPERLVVKCTSVDILSLLAVRAWWPDVPCVVVTREPVEVMVSNLAGGWWMELKANPPLAREILRWKDLTPETMSDEEYCARLLAEFLTSAIGARGGSCKVIDYEELDARGLYQIADFFQIALPDDERDLAQRFAWYSKDPTRGLPFHGDRMQKRRLATPAIIDAAQKWALPLYKELRSRQR